MADAGPSLELPLDVNETSAVGPSLEAPLDVIAAEAAGPSLELEAEVLLSGAEPGVLGRVPGKPYPQPGGVKVQVDGVQQAGVQDTFSLDEIPGVAYTVADNPGSLRTDVTLVAEGMQVLSETVNVALTSVASTLLYTVPGGKSLVVEAVVLRVVQADTVTAEATAGVGSNAARDNVFASQFLTGLDAIGLYYLFPPGGTQAELTTGQSIYLGVDVAAVATALVVEVDLIGRLF
jgi:hypothetical protein